MYFVLTIIFEQDDDVWTAECEELGTATFGDSFEEARENIKDAIDVHINTLKEVGELFKFFEEHNISLIDKPINLKERLVMKTVKECSNFN